MFRLSKAAEYAIRGMLHLSIKGEAATCGIDEIAKAQDVPPAYLAKIFQFLAKKGFVKSFRGVEGGFVLTKKPRNISLLEIIEAMEGAIYLNDCLIREGYCPKDDICPIHTVWKETQMRFVDYLKGRTFEDMVKTSKIRQNPKKNKERNPT